MWKRSDPTDPWQTSDPALALAMEQLRWLTQRRHLARVGHQVSEVLILLTTAAATLAAALQASPWVTASLAAGALVLAGLRKIFDWHENWIAYADAWAQLRAVVHEYRLIPDNRRGEEVRKRLLGRVDEIVGNEVGRWAARRRNLQDRPG